MCCGNERKRVNMKVLTSQLDESPILVQGGSDQANPELSPNELHPILCSTRPHKELYFGDRNSSVIKVI